jgi:predicted HAD superfamily phosphohydrolase YqeG
MIDANEYAETLFLKYLIITDLEHKLAVTCAIIDVTNTIDAWKWHEKTPNNNDFFKEVLQILKNKINEN